MSYQNRYYLSMSHSTKYSYSSLLSWEIVDQYSASGDGGSDVDTSGTPFSSQKVYLITDRNYGFFGPYNSHCIELPLVLSLSGNYQVCGVDGSSFGVTSGDDRCGVGPSTTHFSSHKIASYLSR